jgi:hypothetical protein
MLERDILYAIIGLGIILYLIYKHWKRNGLL